MKNDPFVPSRRVGLAGAAALFLAPLSRTAGAEDVNRESTHCCGNGPPKIYLYGTGVNNALLNGNGTTVELGNPFWGEAAQQMGQRVFVFAFDRKVRAISYRDPDSVEVEPIKFKKVKGYPGVAFLIEEGFTLVLQWPEDNDVFYSTRPLGDKE